MLEINLLHAVSKLYEIMKLRDDVYDRSSRYPVENKSISNIVDKATSTVGPEVSLVLKFLEMKDVQLITWTSHWK